MICARHVLVLVLVHIQSYDFKHKQSLFWFPQWSNIYYIYNLHLHLALASICTISVVYTLIQSNFRWTTEFIYMCSVAKQVFICFSSKYAVVVTACDSQDKISFQGHSCNKRLFKRTILDYWSTKACMTGR